MPGRATASASGEELVKTVVAQAMSLGLEVRREYQVGRRIWGAVRRIDPFMGSGTTGAAALANGCPFLGNDLSPQAVAVTRQRLFGIAPAESIALNAAAGQ
jgi:hypothetical protein